MPPATARAWSPATACGCTEGPCSAVGEATIIGPVIVPPNSLDLLDKRVCYRGQEGIVVGRLDPRRAGKDRLAALREASVTIRFEGRLGATFVEVGGPELAAIETLEA